MDRPPLDPSGLVGREQADALADATQPPARYESQLVYFDLDSSDVTTWLALDVAFTTGYKGNLRPWRRLLAVLRRHGACCAVLEPHYVCLDYRSEFSAYYSQLDAPRSNSTRRLHFFSEMVPRSLVARLPKDVRDGYLGYIVIREGDLPLVGRSVVKVPEYVKHVAAINEEVNFLGQSLQVVGVPFMQQDENFAVCAHIALWAAHYSAFRRGLVERRLIADVVALGGGAQPMRPKTTLGLSAGQIIELCERLGLHAYIYNTPLASTSTLPRLWKVTDVSQFMEEIAPDLAEQRTEVADQLLAAAAVDRTISEVVLPYLDSKFPVYAQTETHALLICGYSQLGGHRPIFFVNDDQNGPYLPVPSLVRLNRLDLRRLGGYRQPPTVALQDTIKEQLPGLARGARQVTTFKGGVHTLVIPAPARALLPMLAVVRETVELAKELFAPQVLALLEGPSPLGMDSAVFTTKLVMGRAYKEQRCGQLRDTDPAAAEAVGCLHLAEWTVVVEGRPDEDGRCSWEIVYDATSSATAPRHQAIRVLDTLYFIDTAADGELRSVSLPDSTMPLLSPETTTRKYLAKGVANDD